VLKFEFNNWKFRVAWSSGRAVRCPPDRSKVRYMPFVYILKSKKNNRYYVGSTNNLERRIAEHNSGRSKYTSLNVPYELRFSQIFDSISIARKVENWIKRQKDKDFLERVIKEGIIKKKFK